MFIIDLSLFIGSCLMLILIGNFLVKSMVYLARFLRLSEFVLGFVLMALSTSLPELSVGVSAALANQGGLILGTVIGSNIANLTLVGGVTALLGRNLKLNSPLIRRDSYWMLFITVLAVVLLYIGEGLSRIDGAILIAVFCVYMYGMLKNRRGYEDVAFENKVNRWLVLGALVLFLVCLPSLFYVAKLVVSTGEALSLALALPPIVIGIFFIALGTSLPELAFSSMAALKRHSGLSIGNLIGSNVVNSTVVLGVSALIHPITGNFFVFMTSSFFMIVISFLFAIFIETSKGLNWKEGFLLVLFYVFFVMIELLLGFNGSPFSSV